MRIQVDLFDENSVKQAVKQINKYKRDVLKKERMLLEKLADYGVERVEIHFAWFQYDGDFSGIEVERVMDTNRAIVRAKGKEIAFIEFGTGVYHNDAESYPLPRPEGIVGIGQYGKGRGNDPRGWYYTSSHGTSQWSRGNPPAMSLYKTTIELTDILEDIVKEVFRS